MDQCVLRGPGSLCAASLTRGAKTPGHYIQDKKLQPLAALTDQARLPLAPMQRGLRAGLQIKVCVHEFNKVDKTQKLKRALRAGEFKERFEAFNLKLKCVSPVSLAVCARAESLARL